MSAALREAIEAMARGDRTLMEMLPGGLHYTVAPDGLAYPLLAYQLVGSSTDWTLGLQVSEEFELQWRAMDRARRLVSFAHIDAIKARLLALFNDKSLTVAGAAFWLCRYRGAIPDYAEQMNNGEMIMHGGLRFRVILG